MARAKNHDNGQRLEEAMLMLIQNQAAFLARQVETDKRIAETERRIEELQRVNSERFARIEALLMEHNRILAEHTRNLQELTEAVREKIGFKPPGSSEGMAHALTESSADDDHLATAEDEKGRARGDADVEALWRNWQTRGF